MEVCRVCLQSSQHARLTRRNLSVFYTICDVYTGDFQKERSVWVCVYCWRRACQCVRFIQLARTTEILLTTNSAIEKKAEEFFPYRVIRLHDTIACKEIECEVSHYLFHEKPQTNKNPCDEPAIYVKYDKEIEIKDENDDEIKVETNVEAIDDVIEETVSEEQREPLVEAYETIKEKIPKRNETHQTPVALNRPLYQEKVNITEQDIAKSLGFTLLVYSEDQIKEEIEKKKESSDYIRSEYKCDKCAFSYECEDDYNTHLATKHSESAGAHSCSVCHYRFQTPTELAQHVYEHLSRGRCLRCEAVVVKANWREHSADPHTNKILHECKICLKKYASKRGLTRHKKVLHCRGNTARTCEICKKIFKNKPSLRTHMLYHLEKTYECVQCNKKYVSKGMYNSHVKLKHTERKTEPIEDRYCVECDKYFKDKKNLETHRARSLIHGGSQKYACETCSKTFSQKINMQSHVNRVHLKLQNFICTECDKGLPDRKSLKSHIRRTHNKCERPRDYICDICGAAFMTNMTLKIHTEAVHEKKRPYKCNVCSATFGFSAALYTHNKLKHKGEKRTKKTAMKKSISTE